MYVFSSFSNVLAGVRLMRTTFFLQDFKSQSYTEKPHIVRSSAQHYVVTARMGRLESKTAMEMIRGRRPERPRSRDATRLEAVLLGSIFPSSKRGFRPLMDYCLAEGSCAFWG